MDNSQLTHELHKLFVQAEADARHFANVHEEVDDHAQRINILTQAMQLQNVCMETVEKWIVAADSNDGLIKEGLKQLEATVTEQGVAISALRGDVQGAVKDIASVMERVAAQSAGNTSHGVPTAAGAQSASPSVTPNELRAVHAQSKEAVCRLVGVLKA